MVFSEDYVKKAVEVLVDNSSVSRILHALADICGDKWETIPNKTVALDWAKAKRDIEHALRSIDQYVNIDSREF